jgi:hypothetical protein
VVNHLSFTAPGKRAPAEPWAYEQLVKLGRYSDYAIETQRVRAAAGRRLSLTQLVRLLLSLEAAAFGAAALVHSGVLVQHYHHREAAIAESVIGEVTRSPNRRLHELARRGSSSRRSSRRGQEGERKQGCCESVLSVSHALSVPAGALAGTPRSSCA